MQTNHTLHTKETKHMSAYSFAELKKNRKNSLSEVKASAEKLLKKEGFGNKDERMWTLSVDENGNGSAIIRFLPASAGEDDPYVRFWDHGFQGPTGLWYIEKSLTSIGKDDPVSKYNSKLWKSGIESDKDIARKQKRRLHYVSNILVIKDPAHPENEGKVFLYVYGKKQFDMLNDLMNPEFDDQQAVNPFDPWEGANFRLRRRKYEGFPNYDKSEFDSPSRIGDDEEIEAIWNKQYPLKEFVDPASYKTYEELEDKLNRVLCLNEEPKSLGTSSRRVTIEDSDEVPFETSKVPRAAEAKRQPAIEEDEDDDLKAFKRALEDD